MKYDCRIEINKPINKVVELFDDPNNLHKWMDGLKSIEYL
ncbi:MAG TPA: SRPBCC family protein [Ignavibacteria bacterium]|mgnify:CR=1 FL=1|nr:SRPBCC family protein [Ignavibacteria bacterium]